MAEQDKRVLLATQRFTGILTHQIRAKAKSIQFPVVAADGVPLAGLARIIWQILVPKGLPTSEPPVAKQSKLTDMLSLG